MQRGGAGDAPTIIWWKPSPSKAPVATTLCSVAHSRRGGAGGPAGERGESRGGEGRLVRAALPPGAGCSAAAAEAGEAGDPKLERRRAASSSSSSLSEKSRQTSGTETRTLARSSVAAGAAPSSESRRIELSTSRCAAESVAPSSASGTSALPSLPPNKRRHTLPAACTADRFPDWTYDAAARSSSTRACDSAHWRK